MLNSRAFWNLFKPASAKFTLDELRELYGVLLKNPVVSEANRAVVVETIRRVAEYMIWGDQNEPRIFDFFLENNIMTYLHKVLLQPANRTGEVAKQVLQTLSIIIQNVRSETAIFFLFSNNHLNDIVDLDFDFEDEEVLGYYISFLKTISLKLNRGTVTFFINTHRDGRGNFPLYTRAIKLAHNREGMVRAAVRTLTLHVYSVVDADILQFVTSPPANSYFTEVSLYLAEQIQSLDRRMLAAEAGGSQALASLDSQLAEVEDVVSYVSDLLSLGVPGIAQLLASSLWENVTQPLLLKPLMQPGAAAAAGVPIQQQQQQQTQAWAGIPGSSNRPGGPMGSPSGMKSSSPSIKGSNWSTGGSGSFLQKIESGKWAMRLRPVCAVFVLERLFQLIMYPPLLQQLLLALTCAGDSTNSNSNSAASDGSAGGSSSSVSCRNTLLGILTSGQPYPAVMVLRLLVAILHNRHISPELLAALSILPRTVQQQQGSFGFNSSSSSSKDAGQLAVMVQAVLKQLQELNVAEQQLQRQPQDTQQAGSSAGSMHRRSSSMNLLNLLTQQYLPTQLHVLVQGQDGSAAAAVGRTAAAAGNSSSEPAGVMQGLEAWLAKAEEVASATALGDAATASSAFSALGPQLLSALLQLLQHAGLPSQGVRLLGWLLHQLLPITPDSPAAAAGVQLQQQQQHVASSPSPLPPTAAGSKSAATTSAGDSSLIRQTSSSSSSSSSDDTSTMGGGSVIQRSESVEAADSVSRSSSLVSGAGASADLDSLADSHFAPPPVSLPHTSSFRSVTSTCEQRGSLLSPQQQQQLQSVVHSAVDQFQQQLHGMWCEAVFPMLAQEWPISREMLQRPVLRAASDALLSGTAAWPLLQGLQAAAAAASGGGGGGAAYEALSVSGKAALACYVAVQRIVAIKQLEELLLYGGISRQPPVPLVTEADLKQVDIQEGYQVDLAPGAALPCVVSFAPGQERRVYFAVAGLSRQQLAALQSGSSHASAQDATTTHTSLVRSLPLAVLADPSPSRPQAGIVLSVAPLLGAHPYADQNVPKWLHVHVRPSVRGLLRVVKTATAKKGGLLSAMRQLADGHWVLAFSGADKAAGAVRLVELHVDRLQHLYGDALAPLFGQQQQQQLPQPQQVAEQQEPDMQAHVVQQEQQQQQLKQQAPEVQQEEVGIALHLPQQQAASCMQQLQQGQQLQPNAEQQQDEQQELEPNTDLGMQPPQQQEPDVQHLQAEATENLQFSVEQQQQQEEAVQQLKAVAVEQPKQVENQNDQQQDDQQQGQQHVEQAPKQPPATENIDDLVQQQQQQQQESQPVVAVLQQPVPAGAIEAAAADEFDAAADVQGVVEADEDASAG